MALENGSDGISKSDAEFHLVGAAPADPEEIDEAAVAEALAALSNAVPGMSKLSENTRAETLTHVHESTPSGVKRLIITVLDKIRRSAAGVMT